MRIVYVDIKNFRGISQAHIYFQGHTVVIGDNNAGKSTIFEAIDLVLGPDRLNRIPVIDEHDFFDGKYYLPEGISPQIEIELLVTGLTSDQLTKFKFHLEFWNHDSKQLLVQGEIQATAQTNVEEALRVKFIGKYSIEDDDFEGDTFFCSPQREDATLQKFGKGDKRECGFLYLRALRTGNRALSMERGSLLDIILRILELRPKMWEHVLERLRTTEVATDPTLGIKGILEGIQESLKKFVPADWGSEPILRVSDLTREHLRKTLTVFMSTGENTYHAPFQHQGTGTINTMVLALLSMIADAKQAVIFAMEEPEIAIPPYTQKRIIDSIRGKSSQAIFSSHSPFVLEEFSPEQIILIRRNSSGILSSQPVTFPSSIRPKNYIQEFRMRFSEALLAKKVLICEGATEAAVYSTAARRLNELDPDLYSSLEGLGVALFDAGSENSIPSFATYFGNLGKVVLAVCDRQETDNLKKIQATVTHLFVSTYKGIEEQIMTETNPAIVKLYYEDLVTNGQWPSHLDRNKVSATASDNDYKTAISNYLKGVKGVIGAAGLLAMCKQVSDFPISISTALSEIKRIIESATESV